MFSERIKQLREEVGLTLEELAERLDTYKSTLSRYENELRAPDIDFVVKLALYFKVSIDWLVGNTDNRYLSLVHMQQVPEFKEEANRFIEVAQLAYESGLSADDLERIIRVIISTKNRGV